MHIAEGVLSPGVLLTGAGLTCVGTAVGLRRLDYGRLMRVGLLSSAFFVASLIHLPLGLSSAHLLGNGLLGVLLGFGCFPAILVALALQALLFQFGGLTVLGVNTVTMASGGVLAWYAYRLLTRCVPGAFGIRLGAFLAGALGVAFAALFAALALNYTDEGFALAAKALFLAHLPIMLAEGLLTMFTVEYLARVRPEMLPAARPPLDH